MLVKEARTIQNRFRNSTDTKRTQDASARKINVGRQNTGGP